MRSFISFFAIIGLLTACAQRPLSTREQGALTGAALGAGTGALIGSATGKAGTGAAIGAGIGLLGGAIVGGAMENQRGETAYPPTAPAPRSPQPGVSTQPVQPQASVATPTTSTVDPTVGQFVNGTRWRLKVFVDADPKAVETASAIVLNPQESRRHNLDLGRRHRIIAQASVDTQFGTRTVGQYDRTIQVDPRGRGWTLRFNEADFR
ncbi:MAG: glycine zipper domain-containing protein [Candidatus Methylomirabilales bacterium]